MILFEHDSKCAAYWFAAEEYIMKVLRPVEPVLMLWSTEDTIMVGANQVVRAECDVAYARSNGIKIVRRSSGGGAIFTDSGTLQMTVILPYLGWPQDFAPNDDEDPHNDAIDAGTIARDWLASPIINTLAFYGAKAMIEGRNDITIDGKKISGIAQYIKGGYILSHCSLLFHTDLEKLAKCLTADREKFTTKALASVRARVTNVAGFIEESNMKNFCNTLIETSGARRVKFESGAVSAIDTIMREKYLNPDWTFGREPAFTFTNAKRFSGGRVEVFLDVKGGVIKEAHISGDFLSLLPVCELEAKLTGVAHRADALAEMLQTIDVRACLGSLSAAELLEVLL